MKPALLFPGQGVQFRGMLRDFYDNFTCAKRVFEEVSEALKLDMAELVFDDPQELLNNTEYSQPAIMTSSMSVLAVCKQELGLSIQDFSYFAGHSLGEYTAYIAAGSIPLYQGAQLLKSRGKFMQASSPEFGGKMLAILGMNHEQIIEVIENISSGQLFLAADNTYNQVIVSGSSAYIDKLSRHLNNYRGARTSLLNVSVPAHSKYMIEAAEKFAELLEEVEIKMPEISVLSNYKAVLCEGIEEIKTTLSKQIYNTVRWREILHYLKTTGADNCLALGPGNILQSFNKREVPEIYTHTISKIYNIEELRYKFLYG